MKVLKKTINKYNIYKILTIVNIALLATIFFMMCDARVKSRSEKIPTHIQANSKRVSV